MKFKLVFCKKTTTNDWNCVLEQTLVTFITILTNKIQFIIDHCHQIYRLRHITELQEYDHKILILPTNQIC